MLHTHKINLLLILSSILFLFLLTPSVNALPLNFQKIDVLGSGVTLKAPTAFEFTQDGRIFVLEKAGTVRVIEPNGTLLPTPLLNLTSQITSDTERGLLGIAVDPNFTTNGYIYLFYTNSNPLQTRISRFTVSFDTADPNSELILLNTTTKRSISHQSGGLRISSDGKLWATLGENSQWPGNTTLLHTPNSLDGKLIRINLDGSIPSDNPFVNVSGARPEVWSYGFRNPYRFGILPNGNPIIGDVGDSTWEEINIAQKGGDFGWPLSTSPPDGPCFGCPYVNPVYAYNHNGTFPPWTPSSPNFSDKCSSGCISASITGGLVYTANQFPAQYKNHTYFFGDYSRSAIYTIQLDENYSSVIGKVAVFDIPGPVVDLRIGPDGSLYYSHIFSDQSGNGGKIFKYVYSISNHPPVIVASSDVSSGYLPLPVNFSSEGTFDQDNDTLTYMWEFGDGQKSTNKNPVHVYSLNGTYKVTLNVSDGNLSSSQTLTISVGNTQPIPIINLPTAGSFYNAGDTINFSGMSSDKEDGMIPNANLSWTIVFHHGSHIHPGPFSGLGGLNSSSFVVPTNGESSTNTSYEIILAATDSGGLTNQTSIFIKPNTVNLMFGTNPVGLNLKLDGINYNNNVTIFSVVGFQHIIDTDSLQTLNGFVYNFSNWISQGGPKLQTITAPPIDTVFTANFSNTRSSTNITSNNILIANWEFNESVGRIVNDYSGNNLTGYITGNPVWKSGGGLKFTPSSKIMFGNSTKLNLDKNFTIVIQAETASLTSNEVYLLSKQNWSGKSGYSMFYSSSNFYFRVLGGGSTPIAGGSLNTLNSKLLLTAVYDGTKMKIYINKTLLGSSLTSIPIASNILNLTVGGALDNSTPSYNGTIYKIRIYDNAFSQTDVNNINDLLFAPPTPEMITVQIPKNMYDWILSQRIGGETFIDILTRLLKILGYPG